MRARPPPRTALPSQDPPRHHSGTPLPGLQGEPPQVAECSQPAVTRGCGLLSRARLLGGGQGFGGDGGKPG